MAPNTTPAMDVEERASGSSDFGALLRRHRLAAGLSQEALAERARMSSDGISALERGHRRTPQRETVALLCAALALNDEQAREFEAAAARSGVPIRIGAGSSPRVPRRDSTASNPLLAHVQIGPFQASLSRPARPIVFAVILVLALSITGIVIMDRATNAATAKPSQAVTTLGPFQFDVSPARAKVTITPISTIPADTTFTAGAGETVEVACNEGTRYRIGGIRRPSATPPTPLPLRYRLIVDGKDGGTYTVGTKFLIDMVRLGATRVSHVLGVDPLDTVPDSTMTFSCVTIVS